MSQSPDEDGAPSQRGTTARHDRLSDKARLQNRLSDFIANTPTTAGWTRDGFRPDLPLLERILAQTDPRRVRGGSVATGLDLWGAAMLRQAGLRGVQPHAHAPFYASQLATALQPAFQTVDDALQEINALAGQLRDLRPKQPYAQELNRISRTLVRQLTQLRQELERPTTSVLGESRKKQVDVFMAGWDRGLELLISTKTFALAVDDPSEIAKNLPNRWEEFDGDLKNLRGRFPLAVIGALTILPATTLGRNVQASVDMMSKITAPGRPWQNAYDCAAIIIADWNNATDDNVPILNDTLTEGQLPFTLQPARFFNELLRRLFERAPISEHAEARAAAAARGEDPSLVLQGAGLTADATDGRDDGSET